jgi:hypothetical protein
MRPFTVVHHKVIVSLNYPNHHPNKEYVMPNLAANTWKGLVASLAVLSGAKAENFISCGPTVYNANGASYNPINCSFIRSKSPVSPTVQTVTLYATNYQPDNGAFPALGFLNVSNTEYSPVVSHSPAPQTINFFSPDSYSASYPPYLISKCSQDGAPISYCSNITPGEYQIFGGLYCADLSQGPMHCDVQSTPCIGEQPVTNISLYSVNYTPDPGAFPVDGMISLEPGKTSSIVLSDKTAEAGNPAQLAIMQDNWSQSSCSTTFFFICKQQAAITGLRDEASLGNELD